MNNIYETPTLLIISFEKEDIITTSNNTFGNEYNESKGDYWKDSI